MLGDIPSLREIWGDAAIFVPPDDTDALRRRRCSADRRLPSAAPRMARRSLGRARCDSRRGAWREAYLEAYRSIAPERRAAVRFVIFTHSLVSDWNHGNAHFLRGVATELVAAGHDVRIFEPRDGWSLQNLLAEHGARAVAEFTARLIRCFAANSTTSTTLDLDRALDGADVVLVHEWNPHELVRRIGEHRAAPRLSPLLPRHPPPQRHRPRRDGGLRPSHYDGVLAYGGVIRDLYLREWLGDARVDLARGGRHARLPSASPRDREAGDLVWVGNWGDGERTEEIREFLIEPVKALGLKARVYGVRYPDAALDELDAAGIEYGGWLPNYRVPEVFAQYRVTVHIPRRPYARALPGIPTIRPFEALACGIPLISAPWDDAEHLFRPAATSCSRATAAR